jgi:hypothetical protein
MKELKTLDIAHAFIQRVLIGNTGTREEFAKYLRISPCRVTTYKNKIEKVYQINIGYSRHLESYYVNQDDAVKLPPI